MCEGDVRSQAVSVVSVGPSESSRQQTVVADTGVSPPGGVYTGNGKTCYQRS